MLYHFIVDCEGWRDKITVFLFIFGWITGGREAYSRNYRHYVIQCPGSVPWWVSADRTAIACVAIEFHDHYTTPFGACCKILIRQLPCKSCCEKVCTWNEYKKWLVILMFEIAAHAKICLQSKHCLSIKWLMIQTSPQDRYGNFSMTANLVQRTTYNMLYRIFLYE